MIFDHSLYRGKKRLAKRHYWPDKLQLIKWALTIKPGDYIATCEGMNRKGLRTPTVVGIIVLVVDVLTLLNHHKKFMTIC